MSRTWLARLGVGAVAEIDLGAPAGIVVNADGGAQVARARAARSPPAIAANVAGQIALEPPMPDLRARVGSRHAATIRKQSMIASPASVSSTHLLTGEQTLPFRQQPLAGLLVARTRRGHVLPEPLRVIQLAPVHQLVNHDVLADERRHQDQPPVQRDRSARRARAPARSLIADRDARHGNAVRDRPARAARPAAPSAARLRSAGSSGWTTAGATRRLQQLPRDPRAAPLDERPAPPSSIPIAAASPAACRRRGRAGCSAAPSGDERTPSRRPCDAEPVLAAVNCSVSCMERTKDTVK